ncbi:MAG: AP2 domain-containing protein [Clostridia bacterium]|nr:AP2 domain-containing protein [Clostridia bacterium]
MIDYTNKRFGKLVAIKRMKKEKLSGWLCKCDCGNEKWVETHNLTRGVKSCGCLCTEELQKARNKIKKESLVEGTSLISLNRKIGSNNKSGIKGVCYSPKLKKWIASIRIKGTRYQKYFNTKNEAIRYREKLEEQYFKPILDKYSKEEH